MSKWHEKRPWQLRYGLAVISVAIALGLTLLLEPALQRTPTPLFFAAVVLSSWYGGVNSGLLATLLSAVAIEYYFLNPDGSLNFAQADPVLLCVFGSVAFLISWLNGSRNQAEQMLRESEERFRLLINGVHEYAIYGLDPKGYIVTWNQGAERMKGYRSQEILGHHFSCFYTAEALEADIPTQALQQAARRGQISDEGWCIRKDGSRFWAAIVITALRDKAGNLRGFSKIVRDATDRRQTEESLKVRLSQQAVVAELGQYALADTSLQALMEIAVDLVAQSLDVAYCNIWELMPDGHKLSLRAWSGWQEEQREPAIVSIDTSSQAGYTLQASEPVVVEDLQVETRFSSFSPTGEQAVSSISLLIPGQERPFGVLEAYTVHKRAFSAHDVHFFQSVANVLATGIQHQTADSKLQDSLKELSNIKFALDQAAILAATDDRGKINHVNDRFCELSKYSRAELIGQDHRIINSGYHSKAFFRNLWSTISSGRVWHGEIKNKAKDGSEYWVDTTIVPFVDDQGKPFQYLAVRFDVTERKLVEESLQQSEERLTLALESANMGTWDWDLVANHVAWSDNNERLFGLPPGTFKKTYEAFLECVHPEDRDSVAQGIDRALTHRQGYVQEFRVVWSDGSVRWMSANSQLLCDQGGRPIRLIGITIDITPQKQAELSLQQLNTDLEAQVEERTAQLRQAYDFEAMLKRITDKVRDSLDEKHILQTAVHELGLGLGVRCCNAALYDLNRNISTIHYEYNTSIFPIKGRVAKMSDFAELYRLLLEGQSLQFCNIVTNPVRGRVTMLACPIFDDQGVLGDLWLITDKEYAFRELELRVVRQVANQCAIAIRQARLYQESQTQVKALERLNWLKDDFLSTVSHELRTPVTNMKLSIRMLSMAIAQGNPTPQQQQKATQYLQILQNECEREISLINDLLDLQRLEAGKRSLALEIVQLQVWLPQMVQPFQQRAGDRQQTLRLDLPSEKLPPLVSDLATLERILSELLNNACKYTPPGETITVSVRPMLGRMEITITNAGVEIAPEELPRIFDKFYRVPSGDRWKQGGTGLGLALVQRLVELLEGKLWVRSADLQTSFTVELPNQSVRSCPHEYSR